MELKAFSEYHENLLLSESLNTPVEFHLTDDTQLPHRVYGVFTLDADTYGMSLERSDHVGIYILKMYRVLAKKPRLWSFKKTSHIRPALSTLLKFTEACVPFVKSQMRGILCPVSGQNVERYIKFAERMLKKSYITSFRVLPTMKSPDKKLYPWENIFFSRIGVSPSAVFADKKFKKYDFPKGVLTPEVALKIKPSLRSKTTLKTDVSKRYTFGELEIPNVTIDSEIFDMVTKVEKLTKKKKDDSKKEPKFDEDFLTKRDKAYLSNVYIDSYIETGKTFFSTVNKDPIRFLASLVKNYFEENTDEKIEDFKTADKLYELLPFFVGNYDSTEKKETYRYIKKNYPKLLDKDKLISKDTCKHILHLLDTITPNEAEDIAEITRHYESVASYDEFGIDSMGDTGSGPDDVFETNLNPEQLVSTLPGAGTFEYEGGHSFFQMKTGKNVSDHKNDEVIDYISKKLGYIKKIQNLDYNEFTAIKSYTDASYRSMNETMRTSFKFFTEKKISSYNDPNIPLKSYHDRFFNDKKIQRVMSVFDKIEPFPESLWVYRNTSLPKEVIEGIEKGTDFVDPAFLSTSIRPTFDFSGELGHRFRIFIPKGSNIIPILNLAEHSSENEIILPPFSILKMIRIDKYKDALPAYHSSSTGYVFTCVFVGSVYREFSEKFKTMKPEDLITENRRVVKKDKSKQKYDPRDKYSVKTDPSLLKIAAKFAKELQKNKKK